MARYGSIHHLGRSLAGHRQHCFGLVWSGKSYTVVFNMNHPRYCFTSKCGLFQLATAVLTGLRTEKIIIWAMQGQNIWFSRQAFLTGVVLLNGSVMFIDQTFLKVIEIRLHFRDRDTSWTMTSRGHYFSKWVTSRGHSQRVTFRGHFWWHLVDNFS